MSQVSTERGGDDLAFPAQPGTMPIPSALKHGWSEALTVFRITPSHSHQGQEPEKSTDRLETESILPPC